MNAVFAGPGEPRIGENELELDDLEGVRELDLGVAPEELVTAVVRDAGDGHRQPAVAVGQAQVDVKLVDDAGETCGLDLVKEADQVFLLVWTSVMTWSQKIIANTSGGCGTSGPSSQ